MWSIVDTEFTEKNVGVGRLKVVTMAICLASIASRKFVPTLRSVDGFEAPTAADVIGCIPIGWPTPSFKSHARIGVDRVAMLSK